MIPTSSNFPTDFDSDDNLFSVHDSIRTKLAEDYNPGDTSIKVSGSIIIFSRMPATGLITLTEQCDDDLDKRAISFYYNDFDADTGTFSGLELLPNFTDVKKPKTVTNVVMNVMDKHHNNLKDSLIAVQTFCGIEGTEDNEPFGDTLEGRVNFLRRIALQPKAWFSSDVRVGNVPLEIEFENLSFRLATDGTMDGVQITWDFGDHTSSTISIISVISADSMVPDSPIDVLIRDTDSGKIKKIYHQAGVYDVKLTVENDFGSDVVVFPNYITARVKAPNEAIIRFIENTTTQDATPGVPPNGPFETPPKIRSPINTIIQIEIDSGENPDTPDYSYAGELLNDDDEPIDPIVSYTWALGDDFNHPNSSEARASYSIGGIYDLKLRVDTEFGAYRITTYEDSIDIVENTNLWLWTFSNSSTIAAYEYGLISETFKTANAPSYVITRDDDFLTGINNESQQKQEFKKNVGFAPRTTTTSGQGGSAFLYYASGRGSSDPVSSELIRVVEFDGFSGTYVSRPSITRPWNWANLNSAAFSYFIFGTVDGSGPNVSPTNIAKQTLDLNSQAVTSVDLVDANYLNGSQELQDNVAVYDDDGDSIYGNFSVYRTAWKDNTGYILRNDGVGPFFRLKSFYRTEGSISSPFQNIRKLQDIQGPTKLEGQLVSLSAGIYMLNNSGSISRFSTESSTWSSGGPGVNSSLFRSLQDTSVSDYDDLSNTMLAASDGDKRAYISFDYSVNSFIKFNEIDLTFSTLGSRPSGEQFLMGIY